MSRRICLSTPFCRGFCCCSCRCWELVPVLGAPKILCYYGNYSYTTLAASMAFLARRQLGMSAAVVLRARAPSAPTPPTPTFIPLIPADKRKAGNSRSLPTLHCNYKHFNAINTHLRRRRSSGGGPLPLISFAWLFCNPKLLLAPKKKNSLTNTHGCSQSKRLQKPKGDIRCVCQLPGPIS